MLGLWWLIHGGGCYYDYLFCVCGAFLSPNLRPLHVLLGYVNLSLWKVGVRMGELESTMFSRVSPIYKEWTEAILNSPSLLQKFFILLFTA